MASAFSSDYENEDSSLSSSNSVTTTDGERIYKNNQKRKSSRRSWVWAYFTLNVDCGTVQCKLCIKPTTILKFVSATTPMIMHLKTVHKKTSSDLENNPASVIDDECYDSSDGDFNEPPPKHPKLNEKINDALIRFLVATDQPISLVSSDHFKNFVKTLNNQYTVPCRQNIISNHIPRKCKELEETVKAELQEAKHVSVTCDTWTSIATESYLSVTVHYIDNNWQMCHRNLCLKYTSGSHTAVNLYGYISEILDRWAIKDKLVSIVSDNAYNIVAAANMFADVYRVPCFGHTINLCVNDIFNKRKNETNTRIDNLINKCKTFIGTFRHSSQLVAKLKLKQEMMNMPIRKLIQDVKTRWHSTFDMLNSLLLNKDPLNAVILENKKSFSQSQTNDQLDLNFPNNEEFHIIEQICKLLEPLRDLVNHLSGVNYVTISLVYPSIHSLVWYQIREIELDSKIVEDVKAELLASIESRFTYLFDDQEDLYLAATFLDVRFKNFEFVRDEENRKQLQRKAIKFLKEYSLLYFNNPTTNNSQKVNNTDNSQKKQSLHLTTKAKKTYNFLKKICDNEKNAESGSIESEIHDYLHDNCDLDGFHSPLAYFKKSATKYPLLSTIVKKLLCVPATSVPSESLFSHASLTVSELRNRLSAENIEKLIFIKENM